MYYNKKYINKYLDTLEEEIKLNYKNEIISTIYIGGGTPTSLDIDELSKLFNILKIFKINKEYEFTIECNIESLTKEKLDLFKKNNVNRLSIGIESFNDKFLKYLNRNHNKKQIFEIIEYAKKLFDNINIDLIYGLKNQTLDDLKYDLNEFLKLGINHISTYSLIIEPHTKLYIDNESNIDEDLEYEMYKYICDTLENNGYIHYEISNFSKEGYESKHNLTYWNNNEYYGFGLGASGFINNIRYDNTKNIDKYLKKEFKYSEEEMTKIKNEENYFILGLRKLKGVSISEFKKRYNEDINIFNIDKLLKEGKLIIKDDYIFINQEYIYLSNDILINFIGEV
jgi:oxygen-independent coproporphyrinogen-3 oxidase